MAGFGTKRFSVHDDYMTPKSAWEAIVSYLPKDKVIWEPFYGNGTSGKYLRELGCNVIHEPIDFFTHNLGDIVVSNPPFSKKKEVIERLVSLDKPFILIMPVATLYTTYTRKYLPGLKILVPRRRIQFEKMVNGEVVKEGKCNFDCLYYCYKIPLKDGITFLE